MSDGNDTSIGEKKSYVEHTRDTISMFSAMLEKLRLMRSADKTVDLSELVEALEESVESMEICINHVNEAKK